MFFFFSIWSQIGQDGEDRDLRSLNSTFWYHKTQFVCLDLNLLPRWSMIDTGICSVKWRELIQKVNVSLQLVDLENSTKLIIYSFVFFHILHYGLCTIYGSFTSKTERKTNERKDQWKKNNEKTITKDQKNSQRRRRIVLSHSRIWKKNLRKGNY